MFKKAALNEFRTSFLSDEFLESFFRSNELLIDLQSDEQKSCQPTDPYFVVRRFYWHLLCTSPLTIFFRKEAASDSVDVEPVFVFKDGKVSEFLIKRASECYGLDLTRLNFDENRLCHEFIDWLEKESSFSSEDWWQWRVEGDSVWIECRPVALSKRREKRREIGTVRKRRARRIGGIKT